MYEMKREITYSQVRRDLKVDMACMAHFFQDAVLVQSEQIGKGVEETKRTKKAWFLSSWQIEVMRYPAFMENVTVRTWPYEFKSMYGYRNFDVIDEQGERIARANSIWIFMDLENMRPTKVTKERVEGYEIAPPLDMEYAPRKIQILDDTYIVSEIEQHPILVKPSFLDSNQHVNNGRYVTEAMDYLPTDVVWKQMRVDYRKAATLGDKMYPVGYRNGNVFQVVFQDETGSPYVIVEMQAE